MKEITVYFHIAEELQRVYNKEAGEIFKEHPYMYFTINSLSARDEARHPFHRDLLEVQPEFTREADIISETAHVG